MRPSLSSSNTSMISSTLLSQQEGGTVWYLLSTETEQCSTAQARTGVLTRFVPRYVTAMLGKIVQQLAQLFSGDASRLILRARRK